MADMQLPHQLLEACGAAPVVESRPRFENRHDVVCHRQPAEYRRLLGEIAQTELRTPVHGHAADVAVVQEDFALFTAGEPDDHVERRGLAGAVGAEQSHDLAALDLQRQIPQYLPRFVTLGEVQGSQYAHGLGLAGGVMMICTRWEACSDASAMMFCASTLYFSDSPRISFWPSLNQAFLEKCTIPLVTS